MWMVLRKNLRPSVRAFRRDNTHMSRPGEHRHLEALPTIMSGLQLYFDRSLGANLLYR